MVTDFGEHEMDALRMLGHIYAETAVGYKKISMRREFITYLPDYLYRNAVIRAIYQMGILLPENGEDTIHRPAMHWNTKVWGAPSIDMVRLIADRADGIRTEWLQQRIDRIKNASMERWTVEVLQSTRTTPCQRCPFKGTGACKVFPALGFDCKSYNMETFKITKDEAGMG